MYTFPKQEHLYGKKNIESLMSNGSSFLTYPLRVVFCTADDDELVPVRVMVSVSKKRFKLAVKRNRIKRLTREAYRLNKHTIVSFAIKNNLKLHIAFQYVATEIETYDKIDEKMKTAIKKIIQNLGKNDESDKKSN
ncbi:MAG: ribonuclease P protein component [Paludibacteraceae bacterium]